MKRPLRFGRRLFLESAAATAAAACARNVTVPKVEDTRISPVRTLFQQASGPQYLALDPGAVYLTDRDPTARDGWVYRIDRASGSVTRLYRAMAPRGITVVGDTVLISEYYGNRITLLDAGSGAARRHFELPFHPSAIRAHGDDVYVSALGRGLYRLSLDGGALAHLPPKPPPPGPLAVFQTRWCAYDAFAIGQGAMHFVRVDNGGGNHEGVGKMTLYRMPLEGGPTETILRSPVGVFDVLCDDTHMYLTSDLQFVHRIPLGGTALDYETMASVPLDMPGGVLHLAQNSRWVAFTVLREPTSQLWMVPKDKASPPVLVADDLVQPVKPVMDERGIYWMQVATADGAFSAVKGVELG